MKRLCVFAIFFVFGVNSMDVSAQAAFYRGVVNRVALLGNSQGDFLVTFDSTSLDDCKNKYVYFYSSAVGVAQVNKAYTMALTSLTAGKSMGVVIDKAINGPGGLCNAMGMTADLRAN